MTLRHLQSDRKNGCEPCSLLLRPQTPLQKQTHQHLPLLMTSQKRYWSACKNLLREDATPRKTAHPPLSSSPTADRTLRSGNGCAARPRLRCGPLAVRQRCRRPSRSRQTGRSGTRHGACSARSAGTSVGCVALPWTRLMSGLQRVLRTGRSRFGTSLPAHSV